MKYILTLFTLTAVLASGLCRAAERPDDVTRLKAIQSAAWSY